MIFRILGVSAALLLAGCSSVPSLHSLLTLDDDQQMQVPADPVISSVAAAPAPALADDWCKNVATNTRNRAGADGFDTPTQDRMALQAYQQCTALGGQN